MSAHCCHAPPPARDGRYRQVLWIALAVNAAMFLVEVGAGLAAGSVSLLADAVDFAGDAANYGLSLAVLAMGVAARARAALVKAASMGVFGALVLARTAWAAFGEGVPQALTMGAVGTLALAANLGVAVLLFRWREGDANMRSVWLCTRNDALGNLAVLAASLGVFGTGAAWPDLLVATAMALLALHAARSVWRQGRGELVLAARAVASPQPGAQHAQSHTQSHAQSHDHDHDHGHGHRHEHGHEREQSHGHEQSHSHEPRHGHEPRHAHGLAHSHAHARPPLPVHSQRRVRTRTR